ncbi:MAG: NADH-ubiquinone oxidoreductase-F iron-sulfur binding region domain-containing protein [Actinomycetes bacterium]
MNATTAEPTMRTRSADQPSRLLAAAAPDLATHERHNGRLPQLTPQQLVELLREGGLLGHGGAAFPVWRKLSAVVGQRGAVVVANGAEGEPASHKDRTLLRVAPHLVLDGLALMAAAVRARRAYLYVPTDLERDLARVARQRSRDRWDRVDVAVVGAPDRFVAGEESAVVSRLSGGPAHPRDKFTMTVEAGVRGRPTVVNNVETLAHVALLARYGAAWFRERGTDEDPGTFLSTVSGPVAVPGVHEVPYGVTVGELLAAAGGATEDLQAVLVGGFHGAWVPLPRAGAVPVSREGLRPFGAAPGAGVVVALPRRTCGLGTTATIVGYLAGQSAGQCGPCVFGLPRLADTLGQLAHAPRRPVAGRVGAEVERLAAMVDGRGACRHPDGTVRLVRSAMSTFRDDVAAHLAGRCLHQAGAVR